jgi:homocitrate synthase
MYVVDPDYVKAKYNLPMLRELENLVADAVQISVPFNNPITGFCAFTHKAGIHAKAILANPSTYEMCVAVCFLCEEERAPADFGRSNSLKPEDFGMSRYIDIGSRLTGWNAVRPRDSS